MPPTAPPITGLPFHIASETVRPKPLLVDFWTTIVAARWSALIVRCASGGRTRT